MNQPVLSVIICTFNRDKYLKECLEHLANQSLKKQDYEVLVINNCSTDNTGGICNKYSESHPEVNFQMITESRQGLSFCRNNGMLAAKGNFVSYLDDDAFADKEYAANLINHFLSNPEVDAIGGKITPLYEGREPRWMSKYLLPLVAALDMGNNTQEFRGSRFPIGANMAFRRGVLKTSEPFDTNLGRIGNFLGSGEEKDLFLRLKKQGKTIHYVPGVHVRHIIPEDRLKNGYIKRMAQGIGKSEAFRISKTSFKEKLNKWMSEIFKIVATIILAISYFFIGKWSKAGMLIKFRIWSTGSFIKAFT